MSVTTGLYLTYNSRAGYRNYTRVGLGGVKGGSSHKNLCMTRVLSFLIRYFSNYYTLHRSDLAARAAPLDPRLGGLVYKVALSCLTTEPRDLCL